MELILYGAGGHSKVVIATIEAVEGLSLYGVLDDDLNKQGKDHFGYPVLGGLEQLNGGQFPEVGKAFVAIGDNLDRASVAKHIIESGYELITLVHPQVVRLRGSVIGEGTVVLPHAFLGADVIIGRGVIISVGAVVGHDVQVKDYGQICPNVSLNGEVVVGAYSFIGAGSVILPGVEVGDHVIVGANTLVKEDLPSGVTAVGSPARIIRRNNG